MLSVCYVAVQRVLQLIFLLFRFPEFKELEIVVLRHELEIPRRQTGRPDLRPADRAFLPPPVACYRASAGARCSSVPTRFCAGIASSWRSAGRTRGGAQHGAPSVTGKAAYKRYGL